MTLAVVVRFEFDDRDRRAIANHYGEPGLASRATIRTWIEGSVEATRQDLESDLEGQEKTDREREVEP